MDRLNQSANATADANGLALFQFPSVPVGLVWTGTILVPGSPVTATFNAVVGVKATTTTANGTTWGTWYGTAAGGPVQLYSNDTLYVVADGLTPGTKYVASLLGYSQFQQDADPLIPIGLGNAGAPGSNVIANTLPNAQVINVVGSINAGNSSVVTSAITVTADTVLTGAGGSLMYYQDPASTDPNFIFVRFNLEGITTGRTKTLLWETIGSVNQAGGGPGAATSSFSFPTTNPINLDQLLDSVSAGLDTSVRIRAQIVTSGVITPTATTSLLVALNLAFAL